MEILVVAVRVEPMCSGGGAREHDLDGEELEEEHRLRHLALVGVEALCR